MAAGAKLGLVVQVPPQTLCFFESEHYVPPTILLQLLHPTTHQPTQRAQGDALGATSHDGGDRVGDGGGEGGGGGVVVWCGE